MIHGGAIQVASGELRGARASGVGVGEDEEKLVGPARLVQGSVGTGDVDGTRSISEETGSVVNERFSAVHGAVSVVINALADPASECIVLILH